MNTDIVEGNKLIAEFMGYTHEPESILNRIPNVLIHPDKLTLHTDYYDDDYHPKYHTSWDWLMPVVEKIGKLYDGKNVSMWSLKNAYVVIFDLGIFATKELVWQSVIQFIKWYNDQPKTNK